MQAPSGAFLLPKLGGIMSENESYGLRLEKKIDNMQSDIHTLSNHVSRLTFINESQQNSGEQNRKDIDAIDVRVSNLETKASIQEGGISVIKIILGLFAGSIISACIWIGQSIIQSNQDQSLMKEKVTRLEESFR